jgi:hypothetical protein
MSFENGSGGDRLAAHFSSPEHIFRFLAHTSGDTIQRSTSVGQVIETQPYV